MKKFASYILLAAMMLSILTGCGGGQANKSEQEGATKRVRLNLRLVLMVQSGVPMLIVLWNWWKKPAAVSIREMSTRRAPLVAQLIWRK